MLKFLLRNQDGQTALLFVGFGAAVAWGATHYPVGTAARMGPGFFPLVLGLILVALGLGVFIAGWRRRQPEEYGAFQWRAVIFITLAVAFGGVLLERIGLAPAVIAATFIGALSETRANWLRVALVALLLVAFAWLVFVFGLGLRLPLVRF